MLFHETRHPLDLIIEYPLVAIGAVHGNSDMESLPGGQAHRERSDPVNCVLKLSEGDL